MGCVGKMKFLGILLCVPISLVLIGLLLVDWLSRILEPNKWEYNWEDERSEEETGVNKDVAANMVGPHKPDCGLCGSTRTVAGDVLVCAQCDMVVAP